MMWIKSSESLPQDKEEVLIRSHGEYRLASFDKEKHLFLLRTGEKIREMDCTQWLKLFPAPNAK